MTVSISPMAYACDKYNRQIIVCLTQYQTTQLTFFFFKTELTKLPNCFVFV